MILTGSGIEQALLRGDIRIEPFYKGFLNPNSYNYRLAETIKVYACSVNDKPVFVEHLIPDEGFLLQPGQMYLANTLEEIGSSKYAMSLIGRSSLGRLGLFLQVSADLGHTLSSHKWTLEIVSVKPMKIYKGMKIGQVSFWSNQGEIKAYDSTYAKYSHPCEAVT